MLHTQITLFRDLRVSALISTGLLVGLAGLFIFPTANMEETKATNTISETTLAMTTADVNLAFNVTNPNGTFSASEPAEFTVTSNNYSGYTLSIGAKEDNADNSKLIYDTYSFNSISSASSENDFTNGVWGYKPSKINSTVNNNYLPAPSYAGDTLDVTNSANNEANSYSIALGAKADYSLPAGVYTNTFVVTAVANPVGYAITYDKNTTDTVSGMPATQTGDVTDAEITISDATPSRENYLFNNWCDGTVTTGTVDTCDGTVYEPGDAYDASQTNINTLNLKALWIYDDFYTVYFDANGGTGTMEPLRIPYGGSATIGANTFTKEKAEFWEWNDNATGRGHWYDEGDTITAPADKSKGTSMTLYTDWNSYFGGEFTPDQTYTSNTTFVDAFASAYAANNKGIYVKNTNDNLYHEKLPDEVVPAGTDTRYAMQDINLTFSDNGVTRSVCDAVSVINDSYQAVDIRDGKLYWILKTTNGRCWMTQNLDLDLSTTTTLTSENTNLNSIGGIYTDGYTESNGIISWTPNNSTTVATSANVSDSVSLLNPRSTDVGDWYQTDQWFASAQKNFMSGTQGDTFSTTPYSGNGTHGHVGNYYNWAAAIASNDLSSITINTSYDYTIEEPEENSICPAGWELPESDHEYETHNAYSNGTTFYWYTGNICASEFNKYFPSCAFNNDFQILNYHYNDHNMYGSTGLEGSNLFFVRSGTISKGALKNVGYDGYYWSSQSSYKTTYQDELTAYGFFYRSSGADGTNEVATSKQRSVRCVAKSYSEQTSAPQYTLIHFIEDSNTGDNSTYFQLGKQGGTISVRTLEGDSDADFVGWNTARDGSGTLYQPRDSIILPTQKRSDLYEIRNY